MVVVENQGIGVRKIEVLVDTADKEVSSRYDRQQHCRCYDEKGVELKERKQDKCRGRAEKTHQWREK